MKLFTVRATLFGLVILAIGPAIALTVHEGVVMHRHHVMEAEQQGLRLARGLAIAHEKVVDSTHALLQVITSKAFSLDLGSPDCGDFMAGLIKAPGFEPYTAAGFFSPSGDLVCNSIEVASRVNVADREWFQRTVATKDFASEGYQIGRTSGRAMVPFGHPVIDRQGNLVAVAILALGVDWLERLVAQTTIPEGASVAVLDEDGVVLTHYPPAPELVGKLLPVPWIAEVLGTPQGTLSRHDMRHRNVLVAHMPLRGAGATILVTLDKTAHVKATSDATERELIALLFILAGACVAAWFGSSLIVRPLTGLVAAAGAIGSGKLPAGTPLGIAPVEFTTLHQAFAKMVTRIKEHEIALKDGRRRMKTLLDSVGEGICGLNRDGIVIFANPEALRLTGWAEGEFIGANMHFLVHHTHPNGSPHPAEQCPMRRAASQGIPAKISDDVMWMRDGTRFDVEYTVTPLTSEAGELEGAVVVFRDVSVRKRQDQIIAHMAGHDTLTDLPNRKLLDDRLTFAIRQARRNQRHIAVLYLDLDKFKPINDDFGHAAGDKVLKEVSTRLLGCVRETDTVARVGGGRVHRASDQFQRG